jgi:hypothetical protein
VEPRDRDRDCVRSRDRLPESLLRFAGFFFKFDSPSSSSGMLEIKVEIARERTNTIVAFFFAKNQLTRTVRVPDSRQLRHWDLVFRGPSFDELHHLRGFCAVDFLDFEVGHGRLDSFLLAFLQAHLQSRNNSHHGALSCVALL